MRRARGFSLIELIVVIAILGVFVLMLTGLEREVLGLLRGGESRRVSLADLEPVLVRLSHDILDASGYYPNNREVDGYSQSETTLILRSESGEGEGDLIVWNFAPDEVQRFTYSGPIRRSEWTWRGDVKWSISSYRGSWVRLRATIAGRPAVDRIWRPRAQS